MLRDEKKVRIYNLGTGVGYSVLDVINAFEKANHLTIRREFKPRRAGDVPQCYSDATKAKEELGWVAKRDIEKMNKRLKIIVLIVVCRFLEYYFWLATYISSSYRIHLFGIKFLNISIKNLIYM